MGSKNKVGRGRGEGGGKGLPSRHTESRTLFRHLSRIPSFLLFLSHFLNVKEHEIYSYFHDTQHFALEQQQSTQQRHQIGKRRRRREKGSCFFLISDPVRPLCDRMRSHFTNEFDYSIDRWIGGRGLIGRTKGAVHSLYAPWVRPLAAFGVHQIKGIQEGKQDRN